MNQEHGPQVALQTRALVEGVKEACRLGGQEMHPHRIAVVVEGVLGSGPAVVGVLSFAVPGLHVPRPGHHPAAARRAGVPGVRPRRAGGLTRTPPDPRAPAGWWGVPVP